MKISSGLRQNSDGELKLYLDCTGSTENERNCARESGGVLSVSLDAPMEILLVIVTM